MANSTMTMGRTLPLGIKLARTYPASQAQVQVTDLVIAGALKLLLLVLAYVVLKIGFNKPFFPLMFDQELYYKDIIMIKLNPMMLLQSSEAYWSINTLYSRLLGFLSILFWGVPPFIIAGAINLACSVLTALYVVKIYYCLVSESYINPRVIFYTIIFSPVLNAYTVLILRDTMIVTLLTMFIYYMLKNNLRWMVLIALLLVGLRPIMAAFCGVVYFGLKATRWFIQFKFWWLYLAILVGIAVAGAMIIGIERVQVAIMYVERMEGSDVSKIFGMGFLDEDAPGVSAKAKLLIRFTAIDAIVVPALIYLTFIPSFRRSNLDTRIFLTLLVVLHFGGAILYLSTLRSFPARKLQMLIPSFYAAVFYYFNLRRSEKMQKLHDKLLYLSQSRREPWNRNAVVNP